MSRDSKFKNTLEEIYYTLRSKYTIPIISGFAALIMISTAIRNRYLHQDDEHILLITLSVFALSMIYVVRSNKREYELICKTKVFAMEVISTYESFNFFNNSLKNTLPYYTNLLIYSSVPKTIRLGSGITLLEESRNIMKFIYETEVPIMSSENKRLYKKAIYFILLLILIDDYHFADIDEPIQKEDLEFFVLLLKELGMDDCQEFAEKFCSREQREILLKEISKRTQFYFG
ncbi:MAG: hypothetical protein J6A43_03580 [Clostridia bacterium]|nr:hypothetical protein [Clostridia bacterium]